MTKTVVLTGGATGVGAATVEQLATRGCRLHVLDLAEPPPREGVTWLECDLGDRGSIDGAVAALPEVIDALVNVAGVAGPEPKDWVLRVNFLGLRHLTERLHERMAPGGSVVNVSSVAGRDWLRRREVIDQMLATASFEAGLEWALGNTDRWAKDPYTFSKQCVTAYTSATAERGRDGSVRVNAVSPGAVDTQLTPSFRAQMGEEYSDWLRRYTGRSALPEEIAEPIVWLAVGDCRWVNGADLVVDRGLSAGMVSGWVDLGQAPGRGRPFPAS